MILTFLSYFYSGKYIRSFNVTSKNINSILTGISRHETKSIVFEANFDRWWNDVAKTWRVTPHRCFEIPSSILGRVGNEASFPSIQYNSNLYELVSTVSRQTTRAGFNDRVDRFSLIFPSEGSLVRFHDEIWGGRNGGDLRSRWKGVQVITPPRDTNKLDTTMDPGKCAAQIWNRGA